ncbi:S41 family peptidase [Chloroflexota bacterium]
MFKGKSIFVPLIIVFLLVLLSVSCAFPASQPSGLDTVDEAWEIISRDYVDKDKLDAEKISQEAIRGMLEAIDDPYSGYLAPDIYQMQLNSIKGVYHGIGAYVTMKEDQLIVIAPIADSPAETAGIRAGDEVIEIDGKPASGMTLAEAVLKIQGPTGTEVRLLILHEGETESIAVTIVRAEIAVKSVFLEMRQDVAYIRITNFSGLTPTELVEVLEGMPSDAEGIILDLRNNPGGALQAVVDVAGQFLEEGVVVRVMDNRGDESIMEVEEGTDTGLPMIVLVNEGSASGSEVLGGALQDYGRAKLAGSKTFGKGSVNMMFPLKDGSALYLTFARWFTPLGRPIEGLGLTPDFPLELEGDELVDWALEHL